MDIRKSTKSIEPRVVGKIKTKVVSKQSVERKKNKKKKVVFRSVSFIFLVIIIIFLSNSKYFKITEIVVSQNISKQDREKVESIIQNKLKKRYLFVIPENNVFIAHSDKISEEVSRAVSGITDISINKKGLNTLMVEASKRTPLFKVIGFDRIYIDYSGVVFENADNKVSTSTVYISEVPLTLSGDLQNLPIDFNQKVGSAIDRQYFDNIKKTVEALRQKNLLVFEVVLYPYSDAEFVLEKGGGKIRINMQDNIDEVLSIFSSAKKIEPLRSQVVSKTNIEYIDLRFGNKVFFKLKQNNEAGL